MSRAYNARRKARRKAQVTAEEEQQRQSRRMRRRFARLAPALLIVGTLAAVGFLGFGASEGISKKQIQREVTDLLRGIPQEGVMLGSPGAPVRIRIYADLECPTVKMFVEDFFPTLIDNWVRDGAVRMDLRSLQTDTADEGVFFEQEIAALAAGRQQRMWNFALTFVRQQGEAQTDYVTEGFLSGIASQVPGLDMPEWRRDREDALLSKQVALGVYSGRTMRGLRSTPSFLIGLDGQAGRRNGLGDSVALKREVESFLEGVLKVLNQQSREDSPTMRNFNFGLGKG